MNRFENIWLSSENHLEIFKEIKGKKNLLSKLEDPNIDERFFDFPRLIYGSQIIPVVFKSIGTLTITDSAIQFYPISTQSDFQYYGINKKENCFICFEQITELEIIKHKTGLIPYFDNSWLKISYKEDNTDKHILISYSGKGFVMKKIRNLNIELLKEIEKNLNIA